MVMRPSALRGMPDAGASEGLFEPSRSNTLLEMQVDTGLRPATRFAAWFALIGVVASAALSMTPTFVPMAIVWTGFVVLGLRPHYRSVRYSMRVVPEGIEATFATAWLRVEWDRVLRIREVPGGGYVEGAHGALLVLDSEAMEAVTRLAPSHVELVRVPGQRPPVWLYLAAAVVIGLMAIAYQLAVWAMRS